MCMRTAFALLGAATLLAFGARAQSDVIIKKRAQEIRDQNNIRQGVAPPSQPRQPVRPAATTPARRTAPPPNSRPPDTVSTASRNADPETGPIMPDAIPLVARLSSGTVARLPALPRRPAALDLTPGDRHAYHASVNPTATTLTSTPLGAARRGALGMASTQQKVSARALGVAFLWLALASSLPVLAQDVSTPIPAAEIAARTAEVAALLANVDSLSAPAPEMQMIEQELPGLSKRLQ